MNGQKQLSSCLSSTDTTNIYLYLIVIYLGNTHTHTHTHTHIHTFIHTQTYTRNVLYMGCMPPALWGVSRTITGYQWRLKSCKLVCKSIWERHPIIHYVSLSMSILTCRWHQLLFLEASQIAETSIVLPRSFKTDVYPVRQLHFKTL